MLRKLKKVADGFAEQLKQTAGISLTEAESVDGKPAISFVLQEGMPKEGYKIVCHPHPYYSHRLPSQMDFSMVCRLFIETSSSRRIRKKRLKKKADWSVPAVEIEDAPALYIAD